jgi:hypothetical protein
MARLIFCATKEGMARRIAERQSMDGQDPFVLRKGSDIPGAIAALKADRDVVANAHAGAVGWTAPDGVTVELDEDMQDERLEALRFQSEARVHRAGRVPSRVEFLQPGPDFDARIKRILQQKVDNPFPDTPVVTSEPETL